MQLHSCSSPSWHTLRMKTIVHSQSVLCWTHFGGSDRGSDETFSLTASIQNSNGQSAQFSAGGNSASATITDDDGMLVQLLRVCCLHVHYTSYG